MGRRLRKNGRAPSIRRSAGNISKIVTFANWCIWGVTATIALVFAGITMKDIPVGPGLSSANPEYLQSVLLTLYIACWAAGTSMDTKIQSSVYLVDPAGGAVQPASVVAVVVLGFISLAVLLTRNNELFFSLAIAAFTTVDVLGWLYLRYCFLPPIMKATRDKYQTGPHYDHYGVVLLDIVTAQVLGNWKWWRQLFLSVIVILMIVVALSPSVKDAISSWVDGKVPGVVPGSTKLLLPDILLLIFIAVSELWHFALRLKTIISIQVLDQLEDKYALEPQTHSSTPRPHRPGP